MGSFLARCNACLALILLAKLLTRDIEIKLIYLPDNSVKKAAVPIK